MATKFKSGVAAIPTGVVDFAVSGLNLDFIPDSVIVRVRLPVAEADLIDAQTVGTPTADGFSVALSSPADLDGYLLDWIATARGSSGTVGGASLAVDYATLCQEVAHFLGYDPDALTARQKSEVDRYVQSGVRQFYFPPPIEGADADFEWDFLTADGTVALSPSSESYLLPDDFGRFAGSLVVAGEREPLRLVPHADLIRARAAAPSSTGTPRLASVIASSVYGDGGQRRALLVWPLPAGETELSFTCVSAGAKLDAEDNPFPLGGPAYAELVIESCLAVAEQRANDETGAHTAKFQQLLASMAQKSRRSGAHEFGSVGDPDAFKW